MSQTSESKKGRILYISYDGLMEPLGQSQVLNYLKGLSVDYQLFVITYEKKGDLFDLKKKNLFDNLTAENNIKWISLRYHSKFKILATFYDVLLGFFVSFFLIISNSCLLR